MIFLSVVVAVSLLFSLFQSLSLLLSVGWRHIIMQTASTTTAEQTASDKAARKGLSVFLIVHPLL